ncbi:MAG: GAF domain-containing protein, partial [Deltaproteobacteria bacterium]
MEDVLQQSDNELAVLNRVCQAFISILDLDQVLATILEEVRRLLGAVACSVWLTDPETKELSCRRSMGPQSDVVHGWRLAAKEGIAGWVAQSGEGLIVPDTRVDKRHSKDVDRETGIEMLSILCVPLRTTNDVIGVIEVLHTQAGRFGEKDMKLVESLAPVATVAIEHARLYEAIQEKLTERERAEAALRNSEEKYRLLVSNLPGIVYTGYKDWSVDFTDNKIE